MNTLETLPEDVFRHLMGFLEPKKVLELRELSTATNSKVEEMETELEKKMELQSVLFQNFQEFKVFVSSVTFAPFTNFHFGFDPFEVIGLHEMEIFMDRYGPKIQRLKIPNLFPFLKWMEMNWLSKMTSLRQLEIGMTIMVRYDYIHYREIMVKANENVTQGKAPISAPTFPECFKNIEKFTCVNGSNSEGSAVRLLLYGLPGLRSFSLSGGEIQERVRHLDNELYILTKYLDLRSKMGPNGTALKYLTFSGDLSVGSCYENGITDFVKATIKSSVRLQNSTEDLIMAVVQCSTLEDVEKATFFNLISHLKGLRPNNVNINFEGLRSIEIDLPTCFCSENVASVHQNTMKDLEEMKVSIFAHISYSGDNDRHRLRRQEYWNFLFGRERESVKEVSINAGSPLQGAKDFWSPLLLVHNFKALESLTLNLHYYKSSDYAILFHELAENTPGIRLIDLKLSYPADADHDVFVGPNPAEPSIVRMKKLRHLRIVHNSHLYSERSRKRVRFTPPDLDVMKEVFPSLSLTCLRIDADWPSSYEQTCERVTALLNGKIGKTLRYLEWTGPKHGDYHLLCEQIERNRKAVTSIIYPGKRCKLCENYEGDSSRDTKWLQNMTLY